MNFKEVVVLSGALLVFIFATLVSWYEGGQLRDNSWEWPYTAVFSNWINGEVTRSNEILVIDHFVYAAKFETFFPLLMAASLIIIIFQVILWLTSRHKKVRTIFFLAITVLFFALSILVYNSPTTGLLLFSIFFGVMSILSLLIAYPFKEKRHPGAASKA